MRDSGRARYEIISDEQAMKAFILLCQYEGIIPALESSHAVAQGIIEATRSDRPSNRNILINLSGRGDKDIDHYLVCRAAEQKGELQ